MQPNLTQPSSKTLKSKIEDSLRKPFHLPTRPFANKYHIGQQRIRSNAQINHFIYSPEPERTTLPIINSTQIVHDLHHKTQL